jgi:hypothetical protein
MTSSRSESGSESYDSEPFRHSPSALELEITEFSLDDDDEWFDADGANGDVFLTEWENDWSTLSLRGTITVEENLESVFPPSEWPDSEKAELILAVKCDYTHLRKGETVPVKDFSEGPKQFEIQIASEYSYGIIQLIPSIVRTADAKTEGDYRTHKGLELASGESWDVHIDETEDTSGPILPPIFKSFEESDNDERFPDDAVYVVDKSQLEAPKLYVNRDNEPIATALNNGPRGKMGRIMKVYTDTILQPALSELVIWTAQDVDEEGNPNHDWQEDLLAQYGKEMYDVDTVQEAGRQLHDEFHNNGDIPQLLDKTALTIQESLEMSEDMNKLVDNIRA